MTPKLIDQLLPGQTLYDRDSKNAVTGLHVRAFPGKKPFYLYYRTVSGTQRRPKIGEYPTLTIEQAREVARSMLLVVANGGDPSRDRTELRSELSVGELFQLTLQKHWNQERFSRTGYSKEVANNWAKNLEKHFSHLKLSEVTGKLIREWHSKLSPYVGNRSLEVLSKMYSFAEEQELRPQNTNPCKLVKAHKEQKRDRYATDVEISRVGEILDREKKAHPREVAFLYLLMFTGSRPSAIESAAASDLQLRRADEKTYGVLGLDGKTGRENVYVPPQAIDLIQKLPVSATLTGIKFPRAFWKAVREEAGCKDLWARDWRRTFATVGMSEGFEMSVISELLNHKSTQTTKIYAKLKDGARQKVSAQTADKMEKLLKGKSA